MTTRFSEADLQAILNKRKPAVVDAPKFSKYHNKKKEVDGFLFDSRKEAKRYLELKNAQAAGEIRNLRLQQPVECVVNGHLVTTWVADFTYMDAATGASIFEDCKGMRLPIYILKRKLVFACTGFTIKET